VITQFGLAGGEEIADYHGEGVGAPWMLTVRSGRIGNPGEIRGLAVSGGLLEGFRRHLISADVGEELSAGAPPIREIHTSACRFTHANGVGGGSVWLLRRVAGIRNSHGCNAS
jgi:hypothetical protein